MIQVRGIVKYVRGPDDHATEPLSARQNNGAVRHHGGVVQLLDPEPQAMTFFNAISMEVLRRR